MTIVLPVGTDKLGAKNHSKMHRVFAIDDSATEQSVFVNSSGNVGIGNINPTLAKLQVTGTGTSSLTNSVYITDSSGNIRLLIRDDGNFGIDTLSPLTNFQVSQLSTGTGTVSTNTAISTSTVTGTNTQFLNTFKPGDTITIGAQTLTIFGVNSNTSLTTSNITANSTNSSYTLTGGNRFNVLGNGNVGINTNTPVTTLDVNGNSRVSGDLSANFISANIIADPTYIQSDTINGYGCIWNESNSADSYVIKTPRYTSYGCSWNESTNSYTNNITN